MHGIVISTHLERSVSTMPNNTAVREKRKTYLEEFKKMPPQERITIRFCMH